MKNNNKGKNIIRYRDDGLQKKIIIFSIAFLSVLIAGIGVYLYYDNYIGNENSSAGEINATKFVSNSNAGVGVKSPAYGQFNIDTFKTEITDQLSSFKTWDQRGINENNVFKLGIKHTENDLSKSYKNWEMKIGKGGQIYSINTAAYGETIPYARFNSHGDYFVDAVWQSTFSSNKSETEKKNAKDKKTAYTDWDIHEAGFYMSTDANPTIPYFSKPIYSFSTNALVSENGKEVYFSSWPQHAHLPQTFDDNNVLITKKIIDLGDGVIEVTYNYDYWKLDDYKIDHIGNLWHAVRTSTLPYSIVGLKDGSYKILDVNTQFGDSSTLAKSETLGNWIAYSKGNDKKSPGIGIIFENKERKTGYVTIVRSAAQYPIEKTDNSPDKTGKAGTIAYRYDYQPGDRIVARYYIVIGTLEEIQAYAEKLEDYTLFEKQEIEEKNSGIVGISTVVTKNRIVIKKGESKSNVNLQRFYTKNSQPIFSYNKSGKLIVTSNPYSEGDSLQKQTLDGLQFIGWASKDGRTRNCFTYSDFTEALKDSLDTKSLDKVEFDTSLKGLYVSKQQLGCN